MSDQAIEQKIQAKGLTAPRIRPQDLEDKVISEAYHHFDGSRTTVCMLTLQNGFEVVGEASAVSQANFDETVGRKVARQKARDKLWALEGYLLKERLYQGAVVEAGSP